PYSPLGRMAEAHHSDWRLGDRLAACLLCSATETTAKTCRDPSLPCSMSYTARQPRRSPPRGAWLERGEKLLLLDCVSAVGRVDQVPALARELALRSPDVLVAAPSRSSTA